jgi:hypothetical protein
MADEITTEAPEENTEPENGSQPEDATSEDLGPAGEKALEAFKSRARDAEKRAKAAERELERLKTASMSEQERAVAVAEATGWQKATVEAGKRLASAEIRAQASEKGLDATAFLEDLDLSRFVDENGDPDEGAIGKAIGRWAQLSPKSPRPTGDIGQGVRGGKQPAQSPRDVFAGLIQTRQ